MLNVVCLCASLSLPKLPITFALMNLSLSSYTTSWCFEGFTSTRCSFLAVHNFSSLLSPVSQLLLEHVSQPFSLTCPSSRSAGSVSLSDCLLEAYRSLTWTPLPSNTISPLLLLHLSPVPLVMLRLYYLLIFCVTRSRTKSPELMRLGELLTKLCCVTQLLRTAVNSYLLCPDLSVLSSWTLTCCCFLLPAFSSSAHYYHFFFCLNKILNFYSEPVVLLSLILLTLTTFCCLKFSALSSTSDVVFMIL